MGGFDFIQGAAEDFICAADFILASQGFHSPRIAPTVTDAYGGKSPQMQKSSPENAKSTARQTADYCKRRGKNEKEVI
jgi:hypothetical protein